MYGETEKAAEGELERLTRIVFPRTIDGKEVYRILEFISGDLGYKINGGNFWGFFSIENGKLKEKYETEIKGMISSQDFRQRVGFSFSREIIEHNNIFSDLRFYAIPGYSLEEHEGGSVQVWRNIKRSVEKYFEAVEDTKNDQV